MDQAKEVTLTRMVGFFREQPADFEPGARFRYSNSGYTMLGYIIEQATGQTYAQALEHYIFRPLGMRHSSFGPAEGATAEKATGYGMCYKNFTLPVPAVHPTVSYATGAIYSTVDDLYRWHRALQDGKLFSTETLKTAYRRDRGPYGYGWFSDSLYGHLRVSHDGNIAGFKANINRFPEDDVVVIALSNANNSGVGGLVRGLVNILYGQPLPRPFSELPVIALSDSAKAHYAGDYLFPDADSTRATVRLRDSRLMMIIPGHPEFELLPVAPWQFKSGTTRIEFMPGAQGQRDQVFLYRKGEISGATRVPVPAGTIPLQ